MLTPGRIASRAPARVRAVGKGSQDGSFPRQSLNNIRQYMSYKIVWSRLSKTCFTSLAGLAGKTCLANPKSHHILQPMDTSDPQRLPDTWLFDSEALLCAL